MRIYLDLLFQLKQRIKQYPRLFRTVRNTYFSTVGGFVESVDAKRFRYMNLLKKLRSFSEQNNVRGGFFTSSGEFYLKMPDGILLFYNFEDPSLTLGDGQSLEFISPSIENRPPLESLVLRLTAREKGTVYLDVGANNGYYYALKVALHSKGSCRIFAFEPDPRSQSHFRKNTAINQAEGIQLIEQALSDRKGTLALTATMGASNYLVPEGVQSPLGTIAVKTNTLDSFFVEHDLDRLDFIKVDIEGNEARFLRGAECTIRDCRPLILAELNPIMLERSGASLVEVLSWLQSLNYEARRVRSTMDALLVPQEKMFLLSAEETEILEAF